MQSEEDQDYRNDLEFKVEKFLDHSQFYLNRLPLLKRQLNDIHRLNQPDLYIEKLNDIDKIVHDLVENLRNIEQLYTQLNENQRVKLDHQVHLLRTEIDREMNEFHRLREHSAAFPLQENNALQDDTTNDDFEHNELRQRHITTNRLNDSYDMLEQDLAYLREKIDEVATLVAQQQPALSRAEHMRNLAQYPIQNASSFFQNAIQNRYVTLASGAALGASIGGPVGFIMGTKIGALVAFTGSAVGALSMNIMRQRVSEANESQDDNTTSYNQAML